MYQGSSEKQDQMSYATTATHTTEKQQVEPTTQVKLATSTIDSYSNIKGGGKIGVLVKQNKENLPLSLNLNDSTRNYWN